MEEIENLPMGADMSRALLSEVSLAELRHEARILLHDLQQQNGAAIREYFLLDPEAGTSQIRFEDALYVVARKYGYKSWQDLKNHLRTTTS
jgi:hypothetical protein